MNDGEFIFAAVLRGADARVGRLLRAVGASAAARAWAAGAFVVRAALAAVPLWS